MINNTEELSFQANIKFSYKEDLRISGEFGRKINNYSENLFLKQKGLVKEKLKQLKTLKKEDEIQKSKKEILILTLKDLDYWDYAAFDYEYLYGEEYPSVLSKWGLYNTKCEDFTSSKGIELRNIILKSSIEFDYNT
jgi:hypothetical protein